MKRRVQEAKGNSAVLCALRFGTALLYLSLLLLIVPPASAALRLGAPFGDHIVLPRDVPVTIWGTGAPGGDTVRVHFAGQSATAHSDWEGRWQVRLAPMKAGGPFQMNVEVGGVGVFVASSAANSTGGLELNDVMVGDLLTPEATEVAAGRDARAEALSAVPYAFVRVYEVPSSGSIGHWTIVWQGRIPPGTARLFNAGRAHHTATGVPVGVIETALPPQCAPSTACSAH